jgi:hypothetical protein
MVPVGSLPTKPNDPFGSGIAVDGVVGWDLANNFKDDPNVPITVTVNENLSATAGKTLSIVAVGSTAAAASITGNTLEFSSLSKGEVGGTAYAAAASDAGGATVSGNTLVFNGEAVVMGYTGGGAVQYGNVKANSVEVKHSSGTVEAKMGIYGGVAKDGGIVESNSVNVYGGTAALATADIFGASSMGNALDASKFTANTVTISGAATVSNSVTASRAVIGAYVTGQHAAKSVAASAWHELTGNGVTLERGSAVSDIAGAFGGSGDATAGADEVGKAVFSKNFVVINGEVGAGKGVYGAAADGSAENDFSGNTVDITGALKGSGLTASHVAAAQGFSGTASGNKVTISASADFAIGQAASAGYVAGAYMKSGSAATALTSNGAEVAAGSVDLEILGSLFGARASGKGSVVDNKAKATGKAGIQGDVYGGFTKDGLAKDNKVELGDDADAFTGTLGTLSAVGKVYGGYVQDAGQGSGAAVAGNSVRIVGSSAASLSPSTKALVYGGYMVTKGDGDVSGNEVFVLASSKGAASEVDAVYGGYLKGDGKGNADSNEVTVASSSAGAIYGGYREGGGAARASAKGNKVTVSGTAAAKATLLGSVYGGFVNSQDGDAVGNTVTFSGAIDVAPGGVDLYGGNGLPGGSGDFVTGNALVLDQVKLNNSLKTVANFSKLRFVVPPSQAGPVVSADTLVLDMGNGQNAAVEAIDVAGNSLLDAGRTIVLVDSKTVVSAARAPASYSATGYQGASTIYTYTVQATGTQLTATVASAGLNPQAKAISELPLADVSFVNRGGDDVANMAIPAAAGAVAASGGVSAFASAGYGKSRHKTGSHVDVKGFTGTVGVAAGFAGRSATALAGLFVEFGNGGYDSYNEFGGVAAVRGKGDTRYIGAGVMGRVDAGEAGSSRPYAEASFRAGKAKSDFSSSDFMASRGASAGFATDARYWGFHAGLGYVLAAPGLGEGGSADFSAKLFHTRRDGDRIDVLGERVDLSAVSSTRLRAGARVTFGASPTVKPFVGAYVEREFGGDSRVTVSGRALPEVSLKGTTGIGEIGLSVAPGSRPLSFEAGVQGFGGRREGVSGSMKLNYVF